MEEIENIKSMRFYPPMNWGPTLHGGGDLTRINKYMFGLVNMTFELGRMLGDIKNTSMVEIGSYKGESTFMFASSFAFDTIYAVDPLQGMSNDIHEDFNNNIKLFKGEGKELGDIKVKHIKLHSFDAVDMFEDESLDFVYIDGDHSYENVKRDIELYLPKIKKTGFIGGHDYIREHQGVMDAVNESLGRPDMIFADTSWLIILRKDLLKRKVKAYKG
jgi:cephalosporin hydroxylase|tara:strand:- start:2854 stop:3504 length:651 start_codon:yes stop_codon:yes gene_type:complete